MPSLRTLDVLLEACGWQVDARLVPLGADLDAGLDRLAALDVLERLGTCELLVPSFVTELAALGTVLVGGSWAAAVHGIPTHEGTPLLLSAADDEAVAALAAVLARRMALLVVEDEPRALYVRPGSLRRNPDASWELPLVGRFRLRLLREGEPWPTEVRVDTAEGPLRVVPVEQLGEEDGVLVRSARRWRERRAPT